MWADDVDWGTVKAWSILIGFMLFLVGGLIWSIKSLIDLMKE